MNKSVLKIFSVALFAFVLGFTVSCSEDEPPLPANLINFETTQLGFDASEVLVTVSLSRAASDTSIVVINLAPNKVTYGVEFETEPPAVDNRIALEIPKGQLSTSFIVTKTPEIFWDGDESLSFTIENAGESLVIGKVPNLVLSFSPIVSTGSTLTLQGKTETSNYTNAVLVDLSGNKQTAYDRKAWALGFNSGDDFRVILNPAFQMLSTVSTKSDINAVTVEDAQASRLYNFNAFVESEDASALTLVDAFNGDLTKTAIAEVSATDASNLVHFVVTGNGSLSDVSTWYKIRVLRRGTNGYTLQFAKVGATTFSFVEIEKNPLYNNTLISLDKGTDGEVFVEPYATNWDIQWSYGTALSSPMFNTPYWVQDFVAINYHAGVKIAEVVSADATASATAYTNFAEANLSGLTFLSNRDVLGTKWRSTQPATGIFRDRFYILQDPHGNYYKMKFNTMGVGGDGGVRGNPVVEYALVKASE